MNPMDQAQGSSRLRWLLGDIVVTAIVDLDPFVLPLSRLFPKADTATLEDHRTLLVPDHLDTAMAHVHLAVQAFLLEVAGRTILVDTCVGEHKPRPNLPVWNERNDTGFLARLLRAGVAPEAVDIVFCTHLHADHVGWNTVLRDGRWVPSFPNARYLIGRAEFAHWAERRHLNHGAFVDSVLPVVEAGQVDLVDDGFSLAPGLTLLPLAGHAPGQMGLLVDRAGARALFCGDAFHSPLQIVESDLSSAFCHDPQQAAILRRMVLARLVDENRLLVPAHFRGTGRAMIRRDSSGGYRPMF